MSISSTVRRMAVGVAAASSMAIILAPSANAAPTDLSVSPLVDGNNVHFSVENQSSGSVGCNFYGIAPTSDPLDAEILFGYATPDSLSGLIAPGATKVVQLRLVGDGDPAGPNGSLEIPDGEYDVYWGCRTVWPGEDPAAEVEYWGTNPPLIDGETATLADPVRVVVPGNDSVPGDPPAECSGSICLPSLLELVAGN